MKFRELIQGLLKKKVEWYHPTLNPYGPLRPGQTEWVPQRTQQESPKALSTERQSTQEVPIKDYIKREKASGMSWIIDQKPRVELLNAYRCTKRLRETRRLVPTHCA